MTSILSSCLIVLKLAMAVNNGLHTMLSNIYSVIENAMDSEQNRPIGVDTVEETSSAPAFQRSVSKQSQILEAFNRRRADPSTYDQTDVLVSNLTPFQEITITHKDVDGRRRKRFPDPREKSRCPSRASNHSSDAWTDEETFSSERSLSNISEEYYSHESEGNQSRSLVSLESEINQSGSLASLESVANESENQSFVSETSDQIKESNVSQCQDTESVEDLSLNEHHDSLSPAKKQPINIESNFLKTINGEIKLNNQKRDLLTSEAIHQKSKVKCPENLSGFAYPNLSTTTDVKGEKISAGVNATSMTTAEECFAESSKLYRKLLQEYFRTEKNPANDLDEALKKSPGIEVSKSNVPRANPTSRNENQSAFEDNLVPIHKGSSISRVPMTSSGLFLSDTSVESPSQQNPQPDLNISSSGGIESHGTGFGYFSKYKPLSVTEHSTTYGVPIPPKGTIKVDKLVDWHLGDSLASFTRPSERYSIDMDIDHDTPFKNPSRDSAEFGNEDILEAPQPFLSDVKNDVPACAELNNSADSEMVSIARFDTLARVLQVVGASEVLNELVEVQVKPLNDSNQRVFDPSKAISGTGNSASAKFSFEDSTSTAESLESTSSQNDDILNLDNFPLADLDTVEEQLKFLDKLSDSYLQSSKNRSMSLQDNGILRRNFFPDVFEEHHKVMLENITNAYKKELDLPTRSAGMCSEELPSISTGNTGLETNFKSFLFLTTDAEPDNSGSEDCWKPCTSPQESTSDETLDVFGLPVFVHSASKPGGIKHLGQENESSKFENEDSSMSECSGILLDDKDNSGSSFILEGTSNETSTPIRGEKSVDPSWISINLSSESLKDFNDYSKSRIRVTECINSDSVDEKDLNQTQFVERMDTKYGPACSDVNIEDGATIQAKDWGNLAAQMSKHIEECISILSIGEDEDEDKEDKDEDDTKILGDCNCEKSPQSGNNCESKEGKYQGNIDKKDILSDETSSCIAMVICSNPEVRTPMSNIESLRLREELETAAIYDN